MVAADPIRPRRAAEPTHRRRPAHAGTLAAGMDVTERFAELIGEPERPARRSTRGRCSSPRTPTPTSTSTPSWRRLDELAGAVPGDRRSTRLVRWLFVDLGFSGNVARLPRPAQLVPERRRRPAARASPSASPSLAMVVGRRVGVDLVGIGMPGHFLLRDRHDPDGFLDPVRRAAPASTRRLPGRLPRAPRPRHALRPGATSSRSGPAPSSAGCWPTSAASSPPAATAARSSGCCACASPSPASRRRSGPSWPRCSPPAAGSARPPTSSATSPTQLGGELGDEYGRSAERFRARLN